MVLTHSTLTYKKSPKLKFIILRVPLFNYCPAILFKSFMHNAYCGGFVIPLLSFLGCSAQLPKVESKVGLTR